MQLYFCLLVAADAVSTENIDLNIDQVQDAGLLTRKTSEKYPMKNILKKNVRTCTKLS